MLTPFVIFVLSTMVIVIALAALLHIEFGLTGIVNFGVAGFWGLGMYGIAVLMIEFELPYWLALPLSVLIVGGLSFLLGWFILELDDQAVLVTTLAFATIVNLLIITEKGLTGGVTGLGTVDFPYDIGGDTELTWLVFLVAITGAFMWYARRIRGQPFGRLLVAVQDNERLARSLGKPAFRTRLIVFTVIGGLMGLVGALSASVYQFFIPQMVLPTMTFTVWIALVLGGRRHWAAALIGGLIVVGFFDIVLQLWFKLPRELQRETENIKFLAYGILLIVLIMYRPQGVLGVFRPKPPREPAAEPTTAKGSDDD